VTIQALGTPDMIRRDVDRNARVQGRRAHGAGETAQKVFDALAFTNALNVYNNSFRGASALGFHKGFQSVGADFNDVVITSELRTRRTCS
jgi:hypothetical protein